MCLTLYREIVTPFFVFLTLWLIIALKNALTRGATVTRCAPVVRGFISMISKVKMQEKIQKDENSKTLTFALTFCVWMPMQTPTQGV